MAKRRSNGDGSICRRTSDGKWLAVLSVRDLSGKRRRITRVGKSREHARLLLDELRQERRGPTPTSTRIAVGEFLESWLHTTVQNSKAAGTLASYQAAVKNHIKPFLGKTLLTELTALNVREWVAAMRDADVGARTMENAVAVLSSAMTSAIELGMILTNPCSRSRPMSRRKDVQPFSIDEAKAILEETANDRLHAAYRLALTIGLRQGELFGLRPEDVNLGEARLKVAQQLTEVSGRLIVGKPKTANGYRTIPLSGASIAAIAARLKIRLREGHAGSPYLFTNRSGGPIRRSNFGNRQWRPLLKRLGFQHRGFHHCRHTAATLMLKKLEPHIVCRILGHSKPSVTMDIYAHYLKSDDAAVIAAVTELIG